MTNEESASAPQFSHGIHLAKLAMASNLPYHAWQSIAKLQAGTEFNEQSDSSISIRHGEFQVESIKIIAFVTSPHSEQYLHDNKGCVSLSDVPELEFLGSERNTEISLNSGAVSLFRRVLNELSIVKDLVKESTKSKSAPDGPEETKSKIAPDGPKETKSKSESYLITGHGLGGSVASLIAMWLFDKLGPNCNRRLLCITFGSPLTGDINLQKTISLYPMWESCFLHVVHKDDPLPRCFLVPESSYRPFGTFLLCSRSGGACFQAPESILELLLKVKPEGSWKELVKDTEYGEVVQRLRDGLVNRDIEMLGWSKTTSFEFGIMAQLAAIGWFPQDQLQDNELNRWIQEKIAKPESTKATVMKRPWDHAKELNDAKIYMANFEWYKKESEKDEVGYYDSYKMKRFIYDIKVEKFKRPLKDYWNELVEETDKKPQKEAAALRTRWLLGGTNFRRMIEPLDIAEYYRDGGKDYLNQGRSKTYKLLEKWLKEVTETGKSKDKVEKIKDGKLTEDSFFWARVEEAFISCQRLKRGEGDAAEELKDFDEYVMGSIGKKLVSPEIFLSKSTFMNWWKEYKEGVIDKGLMGADYKSGLLGYMTNALYCEYVP